jgi:cell division protein FtsN
VSPSQQITVADKLNEKVGILDNQKTQNDNFSITQSSTSLDIEAGAVPSGNDIKKPEVLEEPKIKETIVEPAETTEKQSSPAISTGKMFYLIGGSFAKIENADKLIARYSQKGFNPQIIGQASNGYYRVSIMAYLRKEEAMEELRRIRESEIPGAWVLRQ